MDDHALLALAARLAEQAGAAILAVRARGFAVERKDDLSPVTEADRAAEAIIVAGLRGATPDVPVIAEEEVAAGRITAPAPAFWLVDPLDGTREFTDGKDEFVVNVGLVRDGRMALGVVLIPALGEMFTGIVGLGAWKRDRSGFQAPNPTMPVNISPSAGINTTPSAMRPSRTRPTLTTNSSLPSVNSRVPSSGSTSQNAGAGAVMRPAATSSSAITGTSGVAPRSPATMIASAARSASVTGDRSSFRSTAKPRERTARIAAPACSARRAASASRAWSSITR